MTQLQSMPGSPWLSRQRLCVVLVLTGFLLYANTIGNGYVLDDTVAITGNRIVTEGFSAIPELLRTPYLHGALHNPNDLYRPLSLVTFAVEWGLFGEAPGISHFINVLLFCACSLLLFLFLDELLERKHRLPAFLASLLFTLHPIHTEVVANIRSRDELLCFLFGFAALLYWLRFARNGTMRHLLSACLFFVLSLLSKETSLSFIALVPILFFFWERPPVKRSILISGCLVLVTALVLVLRFSVLNAYDANHPFRIPATENALAAATSFNQRIGTALLCLGMYVKLLVLPYPLRCDYSLNTIPLTGFGDWRVILSLLIYAGMLVMCVWLLLKRRRDILAVSLLFFLVPLALFANIFFLVGATMAERFLFFPSVGFCLAATWLLTIAVGNEANILKSKAAIIALGVVGVIFAFLTIQRNAQWKDELSLFRHDLQQTPENYRLAYYLGSRMINAANEAAGDSMQRAALLEEAISYLEKSIAIYPHFGTTHAQAGITYMNLGKLDSAAIHMRTALSLNSNDTFSRNNLAGVYFKQGKFRESIEECKINIQLYPDYARSYLNIGACYLRMGVADSAALALQKVLELEPDNQAAAYYLSVARNMMPQQPAR